MMRFLTDSLMECFLVRTSKLFLFFFKKKNNYEVLDVMMIPKQ